MVTYQTRKLSYALIVAGRQGVMTTGNIQPLFLFSRYAKVAT
jgi:hypothetical protein